MRKKDADAQLMFLQPCLQQKYLKFSFGSCSYCKAGNNSNHIGFSGIFLRSSKKTKNVGYADNLCFSPQILGDRQGNLTPLQKLV